MESIRMNNIHRLLSMKLIISLIQSEHRLVLECLLNLPKCLPISADFCCISSLTIWPYHVNPFGWIWKIKKGDSGPTGALQRIVPRLYPGIDFKFKKTIMQHVISYTLRDLLRRELTRIRHTPLGALAVLVELTTLKADRKKERLMATIETLLTVWKILHLPETTINVA